MAEINPISALLPHMTAGNCIGTGSRGTVWLIRQAETDRMVAIKRISIPASQKNVQALIFSGAVQDEAGAQEYYNQVARDLEQELKAMEPLSACPNVLPFQGSFLAQKTKGVGYDLFLLSEYCETLHTYMAYNAMTHLKAVNMALDMCTALEAYRAAGLLHRDVKPTNIFVGPRGQYLLGDLGAVKLEDLNYAFIPEDQFNAYSAPEAAQGAMGLNTTIDLYSLGMVLYRIYNGGHAPLEDEKTGVRAAENQRLQGAELPAPMYADYELAELILRLCSPDPEKRIQTPGELRQELQLYMQRNRVSDELIVPPLAVPETEPQMPEEPPEVREEEEPLPEEAEEPAEEPAQAPAEGIVLLDKPQPPTPAQAEESATASNEAAVDAIIAEHRQASEADAGDQKPDRPAAKRGGGRRVLVPVLIALGAVLALMLVYILIFLPRQLQGTEAQAEPAQQTETASAQTDDAMPALNVLSMTARVVGTDTITATLELEAEPASELTVLCSDSYGNVYRQAYAPEGNTFTGLSKGVDYLLTLESAQPLAGVTQVTAVTDNTTNIEAITESELTDTQVQLDFSVSGVFPEQWMMVLSDQAGPIQSATFAGNAVLLKGLNPGTAYTVEFSAADGSQVTGTTTYSFTTQVSVTLKNFTLSDMGKDSVTLDWTASGSLPEAWTLTCTAPDGTTAEEQIMPNGMAEVCYTWEGLETETAYVFSLACEGLKESDLNGLEVSIPALAVSDLSAQGNEDGSVTLAWVCDSPLAPAAWNITASAVIAGQEVRQELTTDESSAVFSGLMPGTPYTFTLTTDAGETPDGVSQCTYETPAAQTYTDHDLRVIAMVMWLRPSQETFTKNNLAQSRTSFAASEAIAFAVQASCSAAEDTVTPLYVLRDASGAVAALQNGTETAWNSLWDGGVYVGSLDQTPQTPGTYTLEIYLNGQFLASQSFTVQ